MSLGRRDRSTLLLIFVVFHLLHPDRRVVGFRTEIQDLMVYQNVLAAFSYGP